MMLIAAKSSESSWTIAGYRWSGRNLVAMPLIREYRGEAACVPPSRSAGPASP
jgi:hypothetical protein